MAFCHRSISSPRASARLQAPGAAADRAPGETRTAACCTRSLVQSCQAAGGRGRAPVQSRAGAFRPARQPPCDRPPMRYGVLGTGGTMRSRAGAVARSATIMHGLAAPQPQDRTRHEVGWDRDGQRRRRRTVDDGCAAVRRRGSPSRKAGHVRCSAWGHGPRLPADRQSRSRPRRRECARPASASACMAPRADSSLLAQTAVNVHAGGEDLLHGGVAASQSMPAVGD